MSILSLHFLIRYFLETCASRPCSLLRTSSMGWTTEEEISSMHVMPTSTWTSFEKSGKEVQVGTDNVSDYFVGIFRQMMLTFEPGHRLLISDDVGVCKWVCSGNVCPRTIVSRALNTVPSVIPRKKKCFSWLVWPFATVRVGFWDCESCKELQFYTSKKTCRLLQFYIGSGKLQCYILEYCE